MTTSDGNGKHDRDDLRRANDRHRHWVPAAVLGFLLLVTYLWTDWMADYPPPGIDFLRDLPVVRRAFNSDGHLRNSVWMYRWSDIGRDGQRQILMLLVAIGFLCTYYLPLAYKRPPLIAITCVGIGWVLGPSTLALFLGWHLLAYATFHSPPARSLKTLTGLAFLAICTWLSFADSRSPDTMSIMFGAALTTPVLYLVYGHLYRPLLQAPAGRWIQGCMAHSCLIYIGVSLAGNWLIGDNVLPRVLGWLLFFWQWERVVMYHADLRDGRIPEDVSLLDYLSIFFTPAVFADFHWLARIPLGYTYVTNAFLAKDKNQVILSGLWLITLSIAFFSLRPVVLDLFNIAGAALDIEGWRRYNSLVDAMDRGPVSALAVWCALFYAFLSFALLWAGVAHLKVGLWRLFGYDIERYFQKPYKATNLVDLWRRYSYHYREFLVRAFYYPVFLRVFKKRLRLRIFVATFAAAGFGNLVYHIMYASLLYGTTPEIFLSRLATIPYYILLGVGIAATQVWLVERGHKRREPWTGGLRVSFDLLAVAGTFGFFVLIRPFHHIPHDRPVMDALRVVLAAFGIDG